MTADELLSQAENTLRRRIRVRITHPDGTLDVRCFLGMITTRGGMLRIRHADHKGQTWFPISCVYDVVIVTEDEHQRMSEGMAFQFREEYTP